MLLRISSYLVVAILSATAGANLGIAATVSSHGGLVLVGKGDGFRPVTGSIELPPGGRVMVKPGGLATITYSASCTVRVGPGFWLVQDKVPCRDGASVIDFTGRMGEGLP